LTHKCAILEPKEIGVLSRAMPRTQVIMT